MPLEPVDRLDDPRLAPYRQLKRTNATRWSETFVVEGQTLVERLLASRFPIVSILATPHCAQRLAALAPNETPVYVLPRPQIEQTVGYNFHRGALACGRRLPASDLRLLLPAPPAPATLVVLPHIDDPENLGAIFRNALALGADAVWLGAGCADPLSRRALRVSMGATLALPWVVEDAAPAALRRLCSENHLELIAAVTDADAAPLEQTQRGPRLALALGSEAHGLPAEWTALCDRRVTIPMSGRSDSLNVATATGILLYHFRPGNL